ncbi:MAG: glycoside hydrolase family 127 protein [Planctomycetota bacterium]
MPALSSAWRWPSCCCLPRRAHATTARASSRFHGAASASMAGRCARSSTWRVSSACGCRTTICCSASASARVGAVQGARCWAGTRATRSTCSVRSCRRWHGWVGRATTLCHEKLAALIHAWGECVAADGYFYFSEHSNAPHYTYDKMVGGLVDAITYAGSREAAELLARITTWAEANLGRKREYAFNAGSGETEWYTLSENLYRAYLATGDVRYREFAALWEYPAYWNLFRDGKDMFGAGVRAYHAYSHVNTLAGAGAAYLVSGEPRYREILERAHDVLSAHQRFATGGFGPDEQLLPAAELVARMGVTHHSFETQCGTWAVFKLCKYLTTITGHARYGDWVERLCWNALAASPGTDASGCTFYYSDYHRDGASKVLYPEPFSCCTGTRPLALAELVDLIYFRDADAVHVNLFLPATVRLTLGGAPVSIRQVTRFPEEPRTTLEVMCARPVRFSIRVRAPGWLAAAPQATVNDAAVEIARDARGWLVVTREWQPGDRLAVTLPMAMASEPFIAGEPLPRALTLGPLVLAVRATDQPPHQAIDLDHPESDLERTEEPLTFRLRRDPAALVRPFYTVALHEPYFIALDPTSRRVAHWLLAFAGAWQDAGRFRYGNVVGMSMSYRFTGTRVRWLGWRFDDGGLAEVAIDGQRVAVVDQYGPGRDLEFDWQSAPLASGAHTIKITLLAAKNPASKDHYLNIAGLEVDR